MTAPATVGKYQVMEALGAGSMGTVYRAYDRTLTRVVALKMINFGQAQGVPREEMAARFRKEARAAAQLSHPAIVTIYDYDDQDPAGPYIAMEYVEGGRLDQYIERRANLQLEDAVCLMQQVLMGLDYAHARGVVHRDIKPANLMLAQDGAVKITDFGIAKILSQEDSLALAQAGTPRYMAPEQYNGGTIDHRVDIHAAGAVLYEVLTGTPAFTGSFAEVMYRVCNEAPAPLSGLAPRVERAFAPVVSKALAKPLEERYASAAAFAQALQSAWRKVSARPLARRLSQQAVEVVMMAQEATIVAPEELEDRSFGTSGEGERITDPSRTLTYPPRETETTDPVRAAVTGEVIATDTAVVSVPARQALRARPAEARVVTPVTETSQGTGYTGLGQLEALVTIERQLAAIVGPVARVLVQRAAARTSNPQELQRLLADNLHRPGEREKFLRAVGAAAPDRIQLTRASGGTLLPVVRGSVSPDVMQRTSRLLARHIGPIAVLLCRMAAPLASGEEQFYEMLAEKLNDPSERERFLRDARRGS